MIWMAKVPWRHAATAYLWERVCVCINFLLYSLCWGMCLHTLSTFCRPSAVTLCPCVRLCVYSALWGTWPILLLFLDNGCIYILILDYLAEFDEGFFVSTVHADSRPEAEHENHCHLYAFSPHFCAANLRHQQTQRHRNRSELGNELHSVYPPYTQNDISVVSLCKGQCCLLQPHTSPEFLMSTQIDNDYIYIN